MSQYLMYDNDNDNICEYKVEIDGNWQIEERILGRASLSCKIVDDNGAVIEDGREVQLYSDDGTYLWGGVIQEVEDYEEIWGTVFYDIKAEDYSLLATRALAMQVYEAKTIEEIVLDLVDNYLASTLDQLYNFGVTLGVIESIPVLIDYQVFNYINIFECFDILCGYGNYMWSIDKNKKLNFYSIGYVTNSAILDDVSGSFSFFNFKRSRSMANYRNYQYVRGNKKNTILRVNEIPSPPPDGNIKTFTLKYPVSSIVTIKEAGVDMAVGNLDTDDDSLFDWFYSYDSNQISTSDSMAAVPALTSILVTYYGLVPVIIASKNNTEIANKGIYQHYVQNDFINSIPEALKFANQLLVKYAEVADNLTFDLYAHTFNIMEQFAVKHSVLGIDENFLVESITWNPETIDSNNIVYTYKVLDGAALGGWEEFFANLLKPKYIENGSPEMIVVLEEWDLNLAYTGQYDITIWDDLLFPANNLYPADNLYPNNSSHTHEPAIVE